jgi:hypothetical protein
MNITNYKDGLGTLSEELRWMCMSSLLPILRDWNSKSNNVSMGSADLGCFYDRGMRPILRPIFARSSHLPADRAPEMVAVSGSHPLGVDTALDRTSKFQDLEPEKISQSAIHRRENAAAASYKTK